VKAVALMYHDVVVDDGYDSSGFPGPAAARYKLTRSAFDEHLDAIAASTDAVPLQASQLPPTLDDRGRPLLLTFDDGGASAVHTGETLARRGWSGNFFITLDQIGRPGFVDRDDIRSLRAMGHLIGSHSCSHPRRISRCSWKELLREWGRSLAALSEIVGEPITTASVPGGYYSGRVGGAAAASGVEVLFTSEPTLSVRTVADTCLLVGRFSIVQGTSARTAGRLAAAQLGPRLEQFVTWNAKRPAKAVLGNRYRTVREAILRRSAARPKGSSGPQ
jgi:peptidoglycan/xylan/chitin deacetylase (PgdA/CDA1 family)